jgi:hypothetical protein
VQEERPLTPAMTAYAQANSLRKNSTIQLVIFVLFFVSIIPAIMSIFLYSQHRLFQLETAIIWLLFLGLFGGGTIFLVLHGDSLVSRDLAGGLYARWTGPFTTRMVYGHGLTSVQVEAGGRKLPTLVAPALYSIGSSSGTVDYLPVSGTLLEVRNEQGALLWTRLVTTTPDSPGSAA